MMRPLLLSVALVSVVLSGCIGDEPTDTPITDTEPTELVDVFDDPRTAAHPAFGWPTMTEPYSDANGTLVNEWLAPIVPAALPDPVSSMLHSATAPNTTSGAGIAVFGSIAIVPGHGSDTTLFDISNPAEPKFLSSLGDGADVTARDVDVIIHPDGNITAIFATNQGTNPVWDITDPTNPEFLIEIDPTAGSHNVAVVPGTPYLYNANSAGGQGSGPFGQGPETRLADLANGITEIYDLTDPAEPMLVQDWGNGYGCHDITFYLNPAEDKFRAYCAGIEMTQIWDIKDPANPTVIANIPVHYGVEGGPSAELFLVNFAHLAMVSHDANVLIIGDETGGGLLMGCDAYIDAQVQTASGPLGNLWFYDLSDETNPMLMSWFSPNPSYIVNPPSPEQEALFGWPGCTAHFGRNIEDTNMLTMAFYGAGVLLIDYSDIRHPVVVDQWVQEGMNTWDVWYYQGYLFTGDMTRGMDVLSLA